MKGYILISALLFTIGNATYRQWHNEPKFVWVPMAAMILFLMIEVKNSVSAKKKVLRILFEYFVLLAGGNLIKQIFYTDTIKQINDYWWWALATVWLIYKLWVEYRKQDRNSGRG